MFNADNETYVYTYNANGERIRKANTETGEGDYYMRDYLGRELVIYDNLTDEPKSANIYGNGLVGKIDVNGTTDNRSCYLKDHLGSIRCVLNANGSILNAQDLYPYGETIREYNGTSSKYKFTEKERDSESTYDYFGARYYDSKLGMWMQVDPLAEKYPGWSAYNYCMNNPLINIDFDGMDGGGHYEKDPNDPSKKIWVLDEVVITANEPNMNNNKIRDYSYELGTSGFIIGRSDEILSESLNMTKQLFSEGITEKSALTKIGALKSTTELLGTTGLLISTVLDAEAYKSGDLSTAQFAINLGISGFSYVLPGVGFGLFIFDKLAGDGKVGGIQRMFDSHSETIKMYRKLGVPLPPPGGASF